MKFPVGPYVYVLLDEDRVPFYVGKGRGRRAVEHLRQARRGAPGPRFEKIRKILSSGGAYQFEIVSEHSTDREAADEEIRLIASLDGLLNQTKGGEIGGRPSDPRAALAKRAAFLFARLKVVGRESHPIAQLLRKEADRPSFNMATWTPGEGVVFGWHNDRTHGLPDRLGDRYAT